ncbi:MAG: sigma 54-interacting transcriptional regulator [Balneolaceae bacterium]|nr:sigma 54-interacting transcriptional regulator [Balneolaceae bacterium]
MTPSSVNNTPGLTDYLSEENGLGTESILMRDIFTKVKSIALLEQHIVLIGEIGVGKKRLAQIIHRCSLRENGPFHTFYCIDVTEAKFKEAFWEHIHFENEHLQIKYEALEKAGGGILYLDQFSELSGEYMLNIVNSYIRGCNQLFKYNISMFPRLILSISQDSFQKLAKTKVWGELLKILNPISIMLPPLRERKEDIPALIKTFLAEAKSSEPSWQNLAITPEAVNECKIYAWPGNVRQLKNAILQGSVLSHGSTIESHHLPFSMNWKLPYK